MNASAPFLSIASLFLAALAAGCASAPPPFTQFPAGEPIALLDGPVHLGDNRAEGQDFPNGDAAAARICSLVNLPRAASGYLEVRNVRQSESLADVITVNGRPTALPMTLERDPNGQSSNATMASPIEGVALGAGPTEICIVAGLRSSGDLDDFEVDQVVLYVQGIDASDIAVRRNLESGRPSPVAPPSTPWGRDQHPYGAPWPYRAPPQG